MWTQPCISLLKQKIIIFMDFWIILLIFLLRVLASIFYIVVKFIFSSLKGEGIFIHFLVFARVLSTGQPIPERLIAFTSKTICICFFKSIQHLLNVYRTTRISAFLKFWFFENCLSCLSFEMYAVKSFKVCSLFLTFAASPARLQLLTDPVLTLTVPFARFPRPPSPQRLGLPSRFYSTIYIYTFTVLLMFLCCSFSKVFVN